MDLQELHRRTGIPLRTLRYAVDHQLVPDLPIESLPGARGRARHFAEDAGFAIVLAGVLLELGLRHATIRGFIQGLVEIQIPGNATHPPTSALLAVLERPAAAEAALGDGVNVRLRVPEYRYDSGWRVPGNPAPISKDYRPRTVVTVDIGQIRDQVFREGGLHLPSDK